MRTLVWSMLLHSAVAMQKKCDSKERVNEMTFAVLTQGGGIEAWGSSTMGGGGEPTGTGFTTIVSSTQNYAALKSDGSIEAWGLSSLGADTAPSGTGFTDISSNAHAFAALKADGSITTWGNTNGGGSGGPTDSGYTAIYSSLDSAFAALKADGSITAWGSSASGGSGAPTGTGFVSIVSNSNSFAALKSDGSIEAWGNTNYASGASGEPTDTGYTEIFSGPNVYAALKADGSISAWGDASGGSNAPTGTGYQYIVSNNQGFAAIHSDGSLVSWGSGAVMLQYPTGTGHTALAATERTFAALTQNGGVVAWGTDSSGGTVSNAPTGTGYTTIFSNVYAFAVLDASGGITAWGHATYGGSGAPTGTGFTDIFSNNVAFLGRKSDGSIEQWGGGNIVGASAGAPPPTGTGYSFSSASYSCNNYNPTGGTASPPPSQGLAKQDPHLSGAHGEKMDFRGRHDAVYAILSVPRLTFSLRTQNATFIKPGYMPKLVHGSFFTDAYWKVTTTDGDVFVVNTSASNIGFDVVDPHGKVVASKPRVWTELNRHDMRILYKQATLVMRVAGWETNVTRNPVYNRLSGPEWRFDLSIRPLNGTGFEGRHGNASGLIAPHGIIGQTWDGDSAAVDGAQDDYEHSGVEVWTTSMAEGGIEGQASEYELENKMAHEFKYARHETTSYTPPRDALRLTGTKRIGELKLSATAVDQKGIGYRR